MTEPASQSPCGQDLSRTTSVGNRDLPTSDLALAWASPSREPAKDPPTAHGARGRLSSGRELTDRHISRSTKKHIYVLPTISHFYLLVGDLRQMVTGGRVSDLRPTVMVSLCNHPAWAELIRGPILPHFRSCRLKVEL